MSVQRQSGPSRGLPAIVFATAVPVLSFFLFGPFTVFGGNPDEFDSGFLQLLPTLLPLAGLAWGLLILPGLALKARARDRYLWLVFALGALVWAQGTFLVHDYGMLDGRGLDWDAVGDFAWLDLVLWAGVALVALGLARRLPALLTPLALVIVALQLVGAIETASSLAESPRRADPTEQEAPPEALFRHSTERNVVHIVLDNFQTDVFAELVAEEESLDSVFEGFVLFTENAAAAPYTNLAIPSILLGRTFDGSIPDNAFHKAAAENGLPSRLNKLGYRVNLSLMQSLQGTRHSATYRIPNSIDQLPAERARAEALDLLDITLFRAAPHLARGWTYNDNKWRIHRLLGRHEALPKAFAHREYLRRYAERIRPSDEGPAYHFIHVWPPHPPYVTNADGAAAGEALPNTRENYRNEARATLQAVASIIEALKQQGLYDNSLIVLQSDHGGAFEPAFTPKRMFALLAIKPRERRGAMTTSKAQTSVTDVAATIVEREGVDLDFPGDSVFTVAESEPRARYYAMYKGRGHEALRRVRIRGPLNDPESYEDLETGELAVHRPVYRYGEVANVGLEGQATGYLGDGWSMPFPNLVWNNGHEATLEIPIERSDRALDLSLWVLPSIHGDDWPRQRVVLKAGNRQIARWELTERESTKLEARIPAKFANSDELVLHFEFPDAVRQRDIGVGQDRRLQAVALGRFRLRESGEQ